MASREGVSHGWVIVDCELSLKKYINLEKVIPAMIEKKLLNRKLGKALMKRNDKALFIDSVLKHLTIEKFADFLAVIRTIEEAPESQERPLMKILSSSLKNMKLKEGSQGIQTVFSEFIEAADADLDVSSRLPPTSTRSTPCVAESPVGVMQGSTVQSSSTTKVAAAIAERRCPFPTGYLSGCKSRSFSREGGMLYSPTHGVTVIVPKAAIPSAVESFVLGLYVYTKGPFVLPKNALLCSPIVWFHHQPRFTFEADVIVKIPHCAIVSIPEPQCCSTAGPPTSDEDDSVCVVTVEEGLSDNGHTAGTHFALTRCLEADFSDGYHAVFRVRHFSPHGVVKFQASGEQSQVRKRLGSNELSGVRKRTHSTSSNTARRLPCKEKTTTKDLQKSGSLQDKVDELYHQTKQEKRGGVDDKLGGMKFCLARCMPTDRSTGDWDVNFMISRCHPTWIQAMRCYAEKLNNGKTVDIVERKFYFTDADIEFVPESWTSNTGCWKVAATETNVLSVEDVREELSEVTSYPPNLTYAVSAQTFPPSEQLDCTIEVKGAVEANRRKMLFFKLRSKTPLSSHLRNNISRGRQLTTASYLYTCTLAEPSNSDILTAISQNDRSFPLNLESSDHVKFLIDISLQLTGDSHPQLLGGALHLEPYQVERIQSECRGDISWQVYSVLREWLAANAGRYSETTLGTLKDALSKVGIEDIKISELSDMSDRGISLLSTSLDTVSIMDSPNDVCREFVLNLSEKLQCCWRQVGSLMGVSKSTLDIEASQNVDQLHEQAYQMLLTWQNKSKHEAVTYGVLFKAVQRVHDHRPDIVNDARLYCEHYLSIM